MKRSLYAFAAAAMLAATISTSAQAADIRVRIGDNDGNSLYFSTEPRVVAVPNTRVYYVQNHEYDMYRYDNRWYYTDGGYWYRASSWRGPFVRVQIGSVPRPVYTVPVRYRRHWTDVSYDDRYDGDYGDRDYDRGWRDNARIRVRIGNRASLVFNSEPRVIAIPGSRVYYVQNQNYDLYRFGSYWYYVDDGYWYRASSWRGPFAQVRVSAVPRQVYRVPMMYRRHWRGADYDNVNYWRSRDRNYRDRDWRDRWRDNDDGDGRDRTDRRY